MATGKKDMERLMSQNKQEMDAIGTLRQTLEDQALLKEKFLREEMDKLIASRDRTVEGLNESHKHDMETLQKDYEARIGDLVSVQTTYSERCKELETDHDAMVKQTAELESTIEVLKGDMKRQATEFADKEHKLEYELGHQKHTIEELRGALNR